MIRRGPVLAFLLAAAQAPFPLRAAPPSRPARTVPVYVWTGPHGTEHFSDRPPPAGGRVARRLLRLPPSAGAAARRRARARERSAARFLARLERARRRARRSRLPRVPLPGPPPAVRVGRPPLWYLPYAPFPGVLPLYPRPPPVPSPPSPAPDLAPLGGGFGICGYEIACPPPPPAPFPSAPPPGPTTPRPPSPSPPPSPPPGPGG